MKPGVSPRTEAEKLRDHALVAEQLLSGLSQNEICAKLNMPRSTVRMDIASIERAWAESAVESVAKIKARECAKLDRIERLANAAFLMSLKGRQRTLQRTLYGDTKAKDIKSIQALVEKEESYGDARLLAILLAVHDRRALLFSIKAPVKLEHAGPGGQAIPIDATVREWSNEEISRAVTIINRHVKN